MFTHIPVLKKEIIQILDPKPNENFIDATLGLGGHTEMILNKTKPNGKLLGIEQDSQALEKAQENLEKYSNRFQYYNGNFNNLGLVVRDWKVKVINGVLLDLGPSTYQLTDKNRGFTFQNDSPLDMRMDRTQKISAYEIINEYSESEIRNILYQGEEKFAKSIAKKICEEREKKPITTTFELIEVIKKATPPAYRFDRKTHFATGTFRSLRIAVNEELENLKKALPQIVSILPSGGRIAVISFHSLEDRIVKRFFADNQYLEVINKQPIVAEEKEIKSNPSARSAKLRGAVKIY